jgi:hypothetical protein
VEINLRLPFLENITLAWRGLRVTNTVAYYSAVLMIVLKSITVSALVEKVTNKDYNRRALFSKG